MQVYGRVSATRLRAGWNIRVLLGVLVALWLTGCGGGSTGGTQSSSSSSATSTTEASSAGGGSGTPSSGSTTDGATTAPTGGASISTTIRDEQGAAVTNATLSARPAGAAKSANDTTAVLTATTDSNGFATLTGLVADTTYTITVSAQGHVTLLITVVVPSSVQQLTITVVTPVGSGTSNVSVPAPLRLDPPITNGSNVFLSWEKSGNPNFMAYALYRGTSADVSDSNGTQIALKLSADDTSFTDTVPSSSAPYYYRCYQKVYQPDNGTFISSGSNVASAAFPRVLTSTPGGQNVDVNTPVQVVFDRSMDTPSVNQAFAVTSSGGEAVTGTFAWEKSDTLLTFTPSTPWAYARTYRVSVGGRDTRGNTMPAYSLSFSTPFPHVSSYGPQGSNVSPNAPITITFDGPVDHGVMAAALVVTSLSTPSERVDGEIAWSGSQLTFTPSARWRHPNNYSVSLPGVGDSLDHTLAFTFSSFVLTDFPSVGAPNGITTGPDGNLWISEWGGHNTAVGRMTPAGMLTRFPIAEVSASYAIAAGADGNLWTTDITGRIRRVTPAGDITMFLIPSPDSFPYGITAGADGNMWFANSVPNTIGRITPGGTITEFSVPTANSYPYAITLGPDGNVWFTEGLVNKIGRITPSGVITEFALPVTDTAVAIVTGPDGNLWYGDTWRNVIGRMTVTGEVTEFSVPSQSGPMAIASGPDGNVWFTTRNTLGRITTSGVITEFVIDSQSLGITAGPDGNIWFTESTKGPPQIGRVTP